jgi:MFS transporter, DHA2 family, glioxin efflux transporter
VPTHVKIGLPSFSRSKFADFNSIVLLYYLPIYFQSILGASPIRSGLDNLPFVLAASVFALLGGGVVMKTGRAQQVLFVGSMLSSVGIGLIYTLDIGSSTGEWVGYQIFLGAVMAFAIMHGLTIAQANASAEDLAAVTANLLCELGPLLHGRRS